MRKISKEVRDEAIAKLRTFYKPGDTAYTMCTHVARSGMMRHIAIIATRTDLVRSKKCIRPVNVSHLVADAVGWSLNKSGDALIVGGCGMDMGFHTVYEMASVLYNGLGENGKPVTNGRGYAIRQSWL